MIDFSAGVGVVAGGGEGLREGDVILQFGDVADAGGEAVDAGGRGAQAGEEAGARGVAERGLAVGVGEERAASGEAVDVRGLDLRMAAEAADPVVLVVDGEEEDVGARGGGEGSDGVREQEGEGEKSEKRGGDRVFECD